MIGHEAICEHPHRPALAREADQFDERVVVLVVMEDGLASVASVEGVKGQPALVGSCSALHKGVQAEGGTAEK